MNNEQMEAVKAEREELIEALLDLEDGNAMSRVDTEIKNIIEPVTITPEDQERLRRYVQKNDDLKSLIAENERLRAALMVYADKRNWYCVHHHVVGHTCMETTFKGLGSRIAHKALAGEINDGD